MGERLKKRCLIFWILGSMAAGAFLFSSCITKGQSNSGGPPSQASSSEEAENKLGTQGQPGANQEASQKKPDPGG